MLESRSRDRAFLEGAGAEAGACKKYLELEPELVKTLKTAPRGQAFLEGAGAECQDPVKKGGWISNTV